ncbi:MULTISPECIES: class I SAM-dependent methyltransferase [unclassified Sphingomonas]|jgi:ubiquinone/menaquinone biosynthesis C-methylase UbiE|uniref:class I SAM-dependent methyltransferase n=1 Tax=unclassified Sphingomonas TaxID=196159 RepID=UPI002150FD36|nr:MULTISPECIES: class I SAM-dependent methyltransferase [unclassified Sphingomonas]MCR5870044.1 methyltransferase domain-containing protein [Sphingomonas sp. J344]UUX98261.1 methyltransferase domain-containing protein [Sphingomonas sp. J315]
MNDAAYTPPLGTGDTADYDRAIRRWTREMRWRRAMVDALAPRPGETIVDVGCGTGSFAVMLKAAEPGVEVVGIDPDEEALAIARAKADAAGLAIRWERGFARDVGTRSADAVVSSLMFHQVPMVEKQTGLAAMHAALRPGGRLVIADYGRQRGLMRLLFRLTIQRLDGVADTQSNADGMLPGLVAAAGFRNVREAARIHTITGTIALIVAERPG